VFGCFMFMSVLIYFAAVFVSVKTVRKTVASHYQNLTDLQYVICARWRFLNVVERGTCSYRFALTGTGEVGLHWQEDGIC